MDLQPATMAATARPAGSRVTRINHSYAAIRR